MEEFLVYIEFEMRSEATGRWMMDELTVHMSRAFGGFTSRKGFRAMSLEKF